MAWFKHKGTSSKDDATPEIAWARDFLRSRLLKQAEVEETPLNDVEIKYLDNCHLEGKAWHELEREFSKQQAPMDFQARMSDILRRAYQNELKLNPEIQKDYIRAVNLLESYWPEFELWSIAIPALAWPEKEGKKSLLIYWIVVLLILALSGWLGLHFLGKNW